MASLHQTWPKKSLSLRGRVQAALQAFCTNICLAKDGNGQTETERLSIGPIGIREAIGAVIEHSGVWEPTLMPRKGLHNFAMKMLTIKSTEVTRTGMFLEYQCAKHLEGWLVCTISYAYPGVSSMWFWLEKRHSRGGPGADVPLGTKHHMATAAMPDLCLRLISMHSSEMWKLHKTQSSSFHRLCIYRTKKWSDSFSSYTINCGCRGQNIAMLHSSKLEGLMLPCATDGRNWAK